MAQQEGGAAGDRESEAEPLGALSLGIAKLEKVFEHHIQFFTGNADAGVPDFDAHLAAAPPAAQQQPAPLGIADGVD